MRAGVTPAVARTLPRASASEVATSSAPRVFTRRTDRETYVSRCHLRRGRYFETGNRPRVALVDDRESTNETDTLCDDTLSRWPRAVRLAVEEHARVTNLTPTEVWPSIENLEKIVPGLVTDSLVAKGPNAVSLVHLALSDASVVAANVLVLRKQFPTANVARVAGRSPGVLDLPPETLLAESIEVKKLLRSLDDVDAAVEANPALLDRTRLTHALSTLKRTMPHSDGAKVLRRNPSMLFVDSGVREGYQE